LNARDKQIPRCARDDYFFFPFDGADCRTPNEPSRPATLGRAVARSTGLAGFGGCGFDGEAFGGAASIGL
jgi:hypothetical protein